MWLLDACIKGFSRVAAAAAALAGRAQPVREIYAAWDDVRAR